MKHTGLPSGARAHLAATALLPAYKGRLLSYQRS